MSIELYFSAAGGVITSVLLPVMIRSVQDEWNAASPAAKAGSRWVRIAHAAWPYVRKYLTLLGFSLLTALLIVAVLGENLGGLRNAFLAGYAWDSTIQKITRKP